MLDKRFSLEGGESLIPAIDFLINIAADKGVEDVVMGMSHRGRLSTLVNILVNLVKISLENLMVKTTKKIYLMEM